MKKFIVTEELLTGVAHYLYWRPYREVVGLIQAIQTMPVEIKEPKPEGKSPAKEEQNGPADQGRTK